MFSQSAAHYDLIYGSFKDYSAEAARLASMIRETFPSARRVLDVACGTGEHARLLVEEHGFEVDGLDLEPSFVRLARAKLPGATVVEADMSDFDLPGRYDVILSLFSSIGYVRTQAKVTETLRRMHEHLAPGGVVLLEPWFPPGILQSGRISVHTAESPAATVCRMSHTEIEGRLSRLRFEYLIGSAGGIERTSEVHELGLFTQQEMQACFEEARLTVSFDPVGLSGRGLYLAHESGA